MSFLWNKIIYGVFYFHYSHGTTKLLTGAGLWGLGAVTGNQALQRTGEGLKGLGVATLIGSHLLPNGRR